MRITIENNYFTTLLTIAKRLPDGATRVKDIRVAASADLFTFPEAVEAFEEEITRRIANGFGVAIPITPPAGSYRTA